MILGFPLTWVYKFQTGVALSTLHAEYVALLYSQRDLFPIEDLLKEVFDTFCLDYEKLNFLQVKRYKRTAESQSLWPRVPI